MTMTWRHTSAGVIALLATTAAACGDDTTGSSGGGGGSGGGTATGTTGGATTGTTSAATTTSATTSASSSSGSTSDGGGGATSDGGGGATSDGGGGATAEGGGGATSDGGGGASSDGGGGASSDGGGGASSDGGGGQGGDGEGGSGGVPASWTCTPSYYDRDDGCDCECGAYDPDCDDDEQSIYGCGPVHDVGEGRACLPNGICEPPEGWSCDDAAYGDGATCDCACGGVDYDCERPALPIANCDPEQSCDDEGECSDAPVTWTCDDDFYADGAICDCACGAYDPDCDTSGTILGCNALAGQTCRLDGTCSAPSAWTCGDDTWDDGTSCNCECGAVDPDCGQPGAIVMGCDAGEICLADACFTAALNDTCATAVPLVEGTVSGTWAGATNQADPGPAPGGCTGYREQGVDVFYTLSLAAGETLTVVLGATAADSALYLLTDCQDAQGSCVEGVDATLSNASETLVYTAPAAQDLFLVVDQYAPSDFVPFELTVSID